MKKHYKKGIAVILIVVIGLFIRLDYYLIMPSRAVELGEIIMVDTEIMEERGSFYLLTVSQQPATLTTILYGYANPQVEVRPAYRVIPEGMDEEEYRRQLEKNMIESRYLAQVVALRRVGYDVEINSDGIEIVGLISGAPAEGIAQEGDIIIEADGQPFTLAGELSLYIQQLPLGEAVNLEVIREGIQQDLSINTGVHPDLDGASFLGIYLQTLNWEPVLPLEIVMNTGRIGGPSAGLMFTLEIINQLTVEDITAGLLIAGTGTIDLDEKVGRVGGVVQKVVSAERAGADYFLVPEDNAVEAYRTARRIEVVPVANLGEALDFLESLQPGVN